MRKAHAGGPAEALRPCCPRTPPRSGCWSRCRRRRGARGSARRSLPAHRAAEHHPVLGLGAVRGLAARGVEVDLEAGVAGHRRGQPPADAPVPRAAVGEPEPRVRRAREAPAEEREPVAGLRGEAPRRLELRPGRELARALRPPQPLGGARRGADGGRERERQAPPALAGVEPRGRARPPTPRSPSPRARPASAPSPRC